MLTKRSRAATLLRANKEWLITWSLAAVVAAAVVHFWPAQPSLVPAPIKAQAGFTVHYPTAGYAISSSSWKYLDQDRSVQFTAQPRTGDPTTMVVFTEQRTPLAYQDDAAAYNRFIGSLRPRATFDVPLGTVAIVNFVTASDYQVVGETGMLNAHGTLVLAHPMHPLSDDNWRALFAALTAD